MKSVIEQSSFDNPALVANALDAYEQARQALPRLEGGLGTVPCPSLSVFLLQPVTVLVLARA